MGEIGPKSDWLNDGRSRRGERGAPGSGQQGADKGEDVESRPGRVAEEDVGLGGVGLREVRRQAASAGVGERGGRGESDSGAPGPGPGRCEAGPGARAPPSRVVLKLKPPAPTEPCPCGAPDGRAAWAGVYPKGQRGFSTRLAHCSGGPPSAALLATSAPGRLLSTGLLSVLYFPSRIAPLPRNRLECLGVAIPPRPLLSRSVPGHSAVSCDIRATWRTW